MVKDLRVVTVYRLGKKNVVLTSASASSQNSSAIVTVMVVCLARTSKHFNVKKLADLHYTYVTV